MTQTAFQQHTRHTRNPGFFRHSHLPENIKATFLKVINFVTDKEYAQMIAQTIYYNHLVEHMQHGDFHISHA